MAVIRDLTTVDKFASENNYRLENLAGEAGPAGDPVLQVVIRDGSTGAGSAAPNERQEMQWGRLDYGKDYWIDLWIRFMELPAWTQDRWCDWLQVHDTDGSPQAPVQWDLGPGPSNGHSMRLNLTKGDGPHSYTNLGLVVLGEWTRVTTRLRLSTGADGVCVVARDGVVPMTHFGRTTDSATPEYGKIGGYRAAAINGVARWQYSGMRLHDSNPLGPTPPPPPADMTGPSLTVTRPRTGEIITDRRLTWAASASDPAGIREVNVTIDGVLVSKEVSSPYGDGSPVTIPAMVADGEAFATVTALDNFGNSTRVNVPILIGATPPTPNQALIDALLAAQTATKNEMEMLMSASVAFDEALARVGLEQARIFARLSEALAIARGQ